jgi:crossover junction endodeoxyribonuclease RuvC
MDPGIKGALSFLHTQAPERTSVYDVPIAGGEINVPGLADLIRSYAPDVAFLERAGARPGQGVVSMFNFGRSYGEVRGAIGALQIPLHFVTPQRWKKHFGLTSDKDQSRMLAIRLFPAVADHFKLKKHDGRAEAALIGLYGAQTLHLLGEGSDATH